MIASGLDQSPTVFTSPFSFLKHNPNQLSQLVVRQLLNSMIEICWQNMSLRSGRDPRRPVRTTLYRRCRIFSDHIGREQVRRRLLSALTSHQAMMPLEMIQYMSAGPRRLANSLTEHEGQQTLQSSGFVVIARIATAVKRPCEM